MPAAVVRHRCPVAAPYWSTGGELWNSCDIGAGQSGAWCALENRCGVKPTRISRPPLSDRDRSPGRTTEIASVGCHPGDHPDTADFQAALGRDLDASLFFEGLSYSHKSAYVLWIESAKKAETRERRIPDAIKMLKEGRKPR